MTGERHRGQQKHKRFFPVARVAEGDLSADNYGVRILLEPCADCGACPGDRCRNPGGATVGPHLARSRAVRARGNR